MGPLVDFAQVAIDASPDVLLVIDAEGILRWASPSLASLGYDPVGQVGVQVLDYVHPDDLGYALGMLTEAVRRPGEHSLPVFRVQHGAGHTVEVEASVANVADGEFEGLLLVLRQVATRGVLPGRRRGLERLLQEVAARSAGAVGEDVASVTDWALAMLGEFHGASSVVLARSEAHGEMRIDHEWVAPGAVSALAISPEISVAELQWDHREPSRERLLDHLRCRRRAPRQVRHARHAALTRCASSGGRRDRRLRHHHRTPEHPLGAPRGQRLRGTTATRRSCVPRVTSCA